MTTIPGHTLDALQLPPPWPSPLREKNRAERVRLNQETLVVLDDDPTGTQTVYDVPILTDWSVEQLREAFENHRDCFYILTNSRSLAESGARALSEQLATNLRAAAEGRQFTVVSRSDSTLRGHFPLETDILDDHLGPFDATLLIPCFQAGGRCTIEGTHYIVHNGELVPVAETPFARDRAFGYTQSELPRWVEEKTGGRVSANEVSVIRLEIIRLGGPAQVARQIDRASTGQVLAVDAVTPQDLDVVVAALMQLEHVGRRYLVRSAADFVAARLALPPRPFLTSLELANDRNTGGLIIAGSYVPTTTEQLHHLTQSAWVTVIEMPVTEILDEPQRRRILESTAVQLNAILLAGTDVLLATSRDLVGGEDADDSLRIGRTVSQALIDVIRRLTVRPSFLIAKGGITSSDIATFGLNVREALVLGQIIPGVPVWRLGPESRFPQLPYVIFPGNVGGPDALLNAYKTLTSRNKNFLL